MKKVSDPPDDRYAVALKKRSGNVITSDPFVSFLYVLMRDRVTPGAIEYVMLQLEAEMRVVGKKKTPLTNGWLARYAKDVVDRLAGKIRFKPAAPSVAPSSPPITVEINEKREKRKTSQRKDAKANRKHRL